MSAAEREEEFQRIVTELVRMGASKVILFGSRARETHRSDSDYDLLVVLPDDESVPYGTRLARLYEAIAPRIAVDILPYTPAEFERLVRERRFVREAVHSGKVLHFCPPKVGGARIG